MSKTPLEWIKDKADYGRECLVCCGDHKEKHSPLPWKIWHYGTSQDPRAVIQDAKGTLILETVGKNDDENADTVLHCVNTHDKLVGLLGAASCPCCDGSGAYYDNYGNVCQCQWCDEVKAVLKEKP